MILWFDISGTVTHSHVTYKFTAQLNICFTFSLLFHFSHCPCLPCYLLYENTHTYSLNEHKSYYYSTPQGGFSLPHRKFFKFPQLFAAQVFLSNKGKAVQSLKSTLWWGQHCLLTILVDVSHTSVRSSTVLNMYYRESAVFTLQESKQVISASIYLQIDYLIDGNFVRVETHIGMYRASYIRAQNKSFNNLSIYFQYHHQVTCWQQSIFLNLLFNSFSSPFLSSPRN